MVLEKASIDEIRDMFLRLQNGTPLNAQQKRDAMGSEIGRVARELAIFHFHDLHQFRQFCGVTSPHSVTDAPA